MTLMNLKKKHVKVRSRVGLLKFPEIVSVKKLENSGRSATPEKKTDFSVKSGGGDLPGVRQAQGLRGC